MSKFTDSLVHPAKRSTRLCNPVRLVREIERRSAIRTMCRMEKGAANINGRKPWVWPPHTCMLDGAILNGPLHSDFCTRIDTQLLCLDGTKSD